MPVSYQPIVPWNARGADPAANYGKGFGLGLQAGQAQAHIAMQRAQLEHENQRTALTIALRQQELERQNMVDQQKLEVAKAYHDQQTALKGQELEMKQNALQEKVKEAATRSLAMERFKQAIANNEDPIRASLGLAGLTGTGALTSKALGLLDERMNPQTHEPKFQQLPDGTWVGWNPGNKNFGLTTVRPDKSNQIPLKDLYAQQLKNLQEMGMHIDNKGVKDELYPILEKNLNELQDMISARQKGGSASGQDLPVDWKVLPWPKEEKDLQKGRLYNSPAKGIMYYNRSGKWQRPESPAPDVPLKLSMTGEDQQPDTEVADTDTENVPEEETGTA